MERRTVLVVGAGIAGLSAAYALQKAGFDVQVFEAEAFCGGRMTERRSGPIAYNTGARLVYPFGTAFWGLVDELALGDAVIALKGLGATAAAQGIPYQIDLLPGSDLLRSPVLAFGDKVRLLPLALDFLRLRFFTDPDALDSAAAYDSETLAGYVKRKAGRNLLDLMIEPVFRGARSWNPEEVSAAFLLTTMPHLIGKDTVFSFKGGIGRVVAALSERLRVRLGVKVTNIRHAPQRKSCEVTYGADGSSGREQFDLVVCAVEGARAAQIVDLSGQERAFFDAVRYNSLGVVHYALKRDVPPLLKFLPRDSGSTISTYQQLLASPATGRLAPQIYCQLTPEATIAARRDNRMQELDAIIRADLRREYPDIDAQIDGVLNQWIEYKLPVPYPGYARRVRDFRKEQAKEPRRIYFCGDYLSQALVTGACRSGMDTAALIATHWR